MKIDEAGLIKYWTRQTESDLSHHCARKTKMEMKNTNNQGQNTKKPLTLKGLSGAFLVLGVGSSLAIAAFFFELVHHRYINKNKIKPSHQNRKPQLAKIGENPLKNLVTVAVAVATVDVQVTGKEFSKIIVHSQ